MAHFIIALSCIVMNNLHEKRIFMRERSTEKMDQSQNNNLPSLDSLHHDISINTTVSRKKLVFFFCIMIALMIASYSNHFHNDFHFDDSHVIQGNPFITTLKNIPLFFKDASTISSLPSNQQYRPMEATTLAIDYWLAGGLNPFWFQLSTFCWYVIQCIMMYFFFLKITNAALISRWNPYFAFATTTWYSVHAANAETINYICARTDASSTCWLILAFITFIYLPRTRKWGLYLVPLIIAALFKQTAIVFPALLSLYVLYFEQQSGLRDLFNRQTRRTLLLSQLKTTGPSWVICAMLYLFVRSMDPSTFSSGGTSVYHYMITQPFVFIHYFFTFLLPLQLSADTDWSTLPSIIDDRFFAGATFIIIMITVAIKTSNRASTRPISFGIFWFFIALLPTSSFIPLAEVMNDHRIFFPFVGLTLSMAFTIYNTLIKNEAYLKTKPLFPSILLLSITVLISAHAYGTYQRNIIWKTEESLWYDVTVKSPQNGRGLMNYGLTQMEKGHYDIAEKYFLNALQYTPYYSSLHINLGILNNAIGKLDEAEKYFENAVRYDQHTPAILNYYAQFNLTRRPKLAEETLLKSIALAPGDLQSRHLIMELYLEAEAWDKLKQQALQAIALAPHDIKSANYLTLANAKKSKVERQIDETAMHPTADNYLQLSMLYFEKKQYQRVIEACQHALTLKTDFAAAYNNLCVVYNELGQYDNAEAACQHALAIEPKFTLAKNNLTAMQTKRAMQ
jgi:Tfp pilus assembly protein PilF